MKLKLKLKPFVSVKQPSSDCLKTMKHAWNILNDWRHTADNWRHIANDWRHINDHLWHILDDDRWLILGDWRRDAFLRWHENFVLIIYLLLQHYVHFLDWACSNSFSSFVTLIFLQWRIVSPTHQPPNSPEDDEVEHFLTTPKGVLWHLYSPMNLQEPR